MSRRPPLVQSLLDPNAYPHAAGSVELIETHISWLFLVGDYVYKVKKPVDFSFLDFTTLDKRRHFCHREVFLNRRMSPEVYLGVVDITSEEGKLKVEGQGEVVDYAVKMRRLPADRAMNALLVRGEVSEDDVVRLAVKIARFHDGADTGPEITQLGATRGNIGQRIQENLDQTRKYLGVTVAEDQMDDVAAYSDAFMDTHADTFARREGEGRVRDCHGDLHTAQIFIENGIDVIDTTEFNDRFRYSDVAADVAFLAMDLDHYERPDLSKLLIDTYVEESGDPGVRSLMDFFKCFRAYVRGKVTSFRLDSVDLPDEERHELQEVAGSYIELAHSYTHVVSQPAAMLFAGLTGTGKSTVAQELARRWGLKYLSSDVVRKELAGVDPNDRSVRSYGQGIYSENHTQQTYEELVGRAEAPLRSGQSVVIDATFRRARDRQAAVVAASRAGAEAWIVECGLSEDEIHRRLDARQVEGTSVSDGTWEIYRQQMSEWEPVAEVPENRHVRLDTGSSTSETVGKLLYEVFKKALESR